MNDIGKSIPGQIVTVLPGAQVTTGDLAYLAGFFDGEGCVQVRKRGRRWEAMLRFANTNYPLMQWISDVTRTALSRRSPGKRSVRPSFEVCIQNRKAEAWARAMRPFARIKADEIDLLLEFRSTVGTHGKRYLPDDVDKFRLELAGMCSILKRRAFPRDSSIAASDDNEADALALLRVSANG